MPNFHHRAALIGLGCLLFGAGCAPGAPAPDCGDLRVETPWVRLPPPGAPMQAAYFELHNPGNRQVIVSGVTSPDFKRVMMHETVDRDGQATMVHLDELSVGPGERVALRPGGAHVMLSAPPEAPAPGDSVTFELKCGAAGEATHRFEASYRRGPPSAS
ncbi:MAG: copper chaperone PCu(A)C [Salinisphaeraceae bacterium]